ncbi:MAG TPA: hypothetical protein DCL66_11760 [Gammaproteobacteria bacterium]|nr:hypothetical protein [Gammaproteobacteria bacterium]|tara:strand:- start:278 stop:1540 length:1263 start_codon:yes stop_codon:yes gene_type:complete
MSFSPLDNSSLDQQSQFPQRTLPIGFMLRLAKALHSYGMTAYEMENRMPLIGEKLGFAVQCLSEPTNLIMSFSRPQEPEPITYVFRVDPGEVNLERQIQVDFVFQDVASGAMTVEVGAQRLDEIASSAARFGDKLTILGFGLFSGAIARLLGGATAEILVALFIGLLTGLIAMRFLKSESARFLFPTIAATISSVIAAFVASFGLLASPYIATLSGVIVLVPGLLLTTAIEELARQNMVSGTARLFSAGTIFMQIGFGLAIGIQLSDYWFITQPVVAQDDLPVWTEWCAVLSAGIGLFFLFKSRPKDLGWVLTAGFVTWGATLIGSHYFGPIMGAFFGALCTGIASNLFERLTRISRNVMLMPGIILLVPGSVGFQSLSLLVEKNILAGLDTAFMMSFVAVALVTGLLLASLIVPPRKIE